MAKKRRGTTLIEYGLLGSLIALGVMGAVTSLGTTTESTYCVIISSVNVDQGLSCRGSMYARSGNPFGMGIGAVQYIRDVRMRMECPECTAPNTSVDGQLLYNLNAKSPITRVYGLSDADTGQSADTFSQAEYILRAGGLRNFGVENPYVQQNFQYEVQTQDGDVYGVFYSPSLGIGYRNLKTGDVSTIQWGTGNMIDHGVMNVSGW